MREAASVDIISLLVRKGAIVQVYDPVAMKTAQRVLPGAVTFCKDPYECADNADAVLLLTEWNEFKQLDMERVKGLMKKPVLLDGRNLYEPAEMGKLNFNYHSVGRPAVK